MVVGQRLEYNSTYTSQWLLVAGSIWNEGTYSLKLLLGFPLKA